jgi:hypothetical protein
MLSSSRWINSTRSCRVYFNIILPSTLHMCPEWLSFSDQNVKCILLLPFVPEWPYLGGYLWTGHLIQILSKCIKYHILFFPLVLYFWTLIITKHLDIHLPQNEMYPLTDWFRDLTWLTSWQLWSVFFWLQFIRHSVCISSENFLSKSFRIFAFIVQTRNVTHGPSLILNIPIGIV